jgi:hypothetical protein
MPNSTLHIACLYIHVFELRLEPIHNSSNLFIFIRNEGAKIKFYRVRTISRFMLSIALSMFLTTPTMLPVTWRIVTAVSTRELTASILYIFVVSNTTSAEIRISLP